MLARFTKKFFARRGPGLQGFKTHALGCEFVIVAFLGLVERVREPCPLVVQLGKIGRAPLPESFCFSGP